MASTVSERKKEKTNSKKTFYIETWSKHITGINVSRQKYIKDESRSGVTPNINFKIAHTAWSGRWYR